MQGSRTANCERKVHQFSLVSAAKGEANVNLQPFTLSVQSVGLSPPKNFIHLKNSINSQSNGNVYHLHAPCQCRALRTTHNALLLRHNVVVVVHTDWVRSRTFVQASRFGFNHFKSACMCLNKRSSIITVIQSVLMR